MRQVDQSAGNGPHGHVGVAAGQRLGDDGDEAVVPQNQVTVDRVDFLPFRGVLVPVLFRQPNQFDRGSGVFLGNQAKTDGDGRQ